MNNKEPLANAHLCVPTHPPPGLGWNPTSCITPISSITPGPILLFFHHSCPDFFLTLGSSIITLDFSITLGSSITPGSSIITFGYITPCFSITLPLVPLLSPSSPLFLSSPVFSSLLPPGSFITPGSSSSPPVLGRVVHLKEDCCHLSQHVIVEIPDLKVSKESNETR